MKSDFPPYELTSPRAKPWKKLKFRIQIYLVFFTLICYRKHFDVSFVLVFGLDFIIVWVWIFDIFKMGIYLEMRRGTHFLPFLIKFLALLDLSLDPYYLLFGLYFRMLHTFSESLFRDFLVHYDSRSECWNLCVLWLWDLETGYWSVKRLGVVLQRQRSISHDA